MNGNIGGAPVRRHFPKRRFFKYRECICAAEPAEFTARTWPVFLRPVMRGGVDEKRTSVEIDFDLAACVAGSRNLVLLKVNAALMRARDAGGLFKVADVRFDRADCTEAPTIWSRCGTLAQRVDLERVADDGPVPWHST